MILRFPQLTCFWYKDYCYKVVKRYNLKTVELLNEPHYFYTGTMEQYVEQVRAGSQGVKQADPNCKVIAGYGGGDIDDIYKSTFPLSNLVTLGLLDTIDGLAIHPYSGKNAPELMWEMEFATLQRFLSEIGKPNFPLYATEWGYPASLGLDIQADYTTRAAKIMQDKGLPMSIYFTFFNTDVGTPGDADKSLVADWNLTPRLVYYQYGKVITGIVPVVPGEPFFTWVIPAVIAGGGISIVLAYFALRGGRKT